MQAIEGDLLAIGLINKLDLITQYVILISKLITISETITLKMDLQQCIINAL